MKSVFPADAVLVEAVLPARVCLKKVWFISFVSVVERHKTKKTQGVCIDAAMLSEKSSLFHLTFTCSLARKLD